MKKITNIILIVFIISYITSLNLPSLSKITFFIKHISLFIVLVLISYKLIEYFYNQLMKKAESKEKFQNIIRLMKVVIFGIVLVVISALQTTYIERKETLTTQGCLYYDLYDNLIYQSYYTGKCPELQMSKSNEDSVTYTVIETKKAYYDKFQLTPDWVDPVEVPEHEGIVILYLKDVDMDFKFKTDLEINYDDFNRIIQVNTKSTELVKIDHNKEITYYYRSFYQKVSNTYESDSFESIALYAEVKDRQYTPVTDTEVTHYHFTDDEIKTTRLYTVNDSQNHLSVYKESLVDNEVKRELLASSVINVEDGKTEIITDIKDMKYDIKSSNKLLISEDQIEFGLYESFGSTIVNQTSWNRFREFNDVVDTKSVIHFDDTESNYDYKRYYDLIRDTVILEGVFIYELENHPNGTIVTRYEKADLPLFSNMENSHSYHYFDLLYKPTQLFDYEYHLNNSHSAGDVIYQKMPIFHQYY